MKTLFLICGLYVCVDIAIAGERNFRIRFDEFAVKYKVPDLFERMECNLRNVYNRSYVNAEMILKRNVEDVNVRANMEFWKPNSRQKQKLYDVQVDGCSFLRRIHNNNLFNIYMKSYQKHVNVKLGCPLKANFTYKLKDWYFDEEDLPPFTPTGQFSTLTEYYIQKRLVIRVVSNGEVMKVWK